MCPHRKVQIFELGVNHLRNHCWGPGESIDTHIVGFHDESADVLNWWQKVLGPKIWTPGSESSEN